MIGGNLAQEISDALKNMLKINVNNLIIIVINILRRKGGAGEADPGAGRSLLMPRPRTSLCNRATKVPC